MTTMYKFQKENTVLFRLENRPHYTYTVFPGSSIKEQIVYEAYTRPVIPWKLSCEFEFEETRNSYLSLIR